MINRYRRGLETCQQAKTSKSGHAIFFSHAESEILASNFGRFRLYRLNKKNVSFQVILTLKKSLRWSSCCLCVLKIELQKKPGKQFFIIRRKALFISQRSFKTVLSTFIINIYSQSKVYISIINMF